MTNHLESAEYTVTKEKVAGLRARLAAIQARTDLAPSIRRESIRSYEDMIRQMTKEMRLYEVSHCESAHTSQPSADEAIC